MSVYVDAYRAPFRGMVMSHMMADTPEELHAMAAKLGLKRTWFQGNHYDVSETKRCEAIKLGAKAVTGRELVPIIRAWRAAGWWK